MRIVDWKPTDVQREIILDALDDMIDADTKDQQDALALRDELQGAPLLGED